MMHQGEQQASQAHLPALTGIRFFAIFHIFLHHVWATHNYYSQQPGVTAGLFSTLDDAPETLMVFLSNGWVSTSLFFMLSGFILAYLYWHKDGHFAASRKHFWVQRFARIYPIHLLVLALLIAIKFETYVEQDQSTAFLVASALGTATLVQAWIPPFIPMWNWPTWTISVMVFLYLAMPYLISGLNKLSPARQKGLLVTLPFVSVLPAVIYWWRAESGAPWSWNLELFFSNFPLFWLAYFVAGMLLTRVFGLTRHASVSAQTTRFSLGDVALIVILTLVIIPDTEASTKHLLRYGLIMPLYMVFIVDLARGRGVVARLLAFRLCEKLGELGFSIFIWQSVIFAGAFLLTEHYPDSAEYQVWMAIAGVMMAASLSTFLVEKPIAKWVKGRMTDRKNRR